MTPRKKGSTNKAFVDRFEAELEYGRSLLSNVDDEDEGEEMPEMKPEERRMTRDAEGDTLEIETDDEDATTYHCSNCEYDEISHGQPQCPKCGASFDWSRLG